MSNASFASQDLITRQIRHLVGVHVESQAKIRPHFFLAGPSGTGKSFLTKSVCEQMEVPYFEVNAAQLTGEGLSGNSLSKALRPLRQHWHQPNVIFVDEFDKLFQRNGESTEGFRSGVQDEFLHVLEAKNASIFTDYGKYEPVQVDNSLFIFAGAFGGRQISDLKDLREAGMRTEFVGRVPLVFSTKTIPVDELKKALPKMVLFQRYLGMNTNITEKQAVKDICALMEKQIKNSDLGIRLLTSVIHTYFMKDIK